MSEAFNQNRKAKRKGKYKYPAGTDRVQVLLPEAVHNRQVISRMTSKIKRAIRQGGRKGKRRNKK